MGITERKEREKQEMRERILRAATDMFVEEGFEKTSIRKIADAIEYSPATIYLYFKDKNELFYAIQKEAFNTFFQYFQRVGAMPDPVQRLNELGKVYIRFAIENAGYYDLMFIMRAPMETDATAHHWDEGMRSHKVLQDIVQDCCDAGHFAGQDPLIVAHAIWSFVHGLASLYIRDRMNMFPEERRKTMMDEAMMVFDQWMQKL